MNETLTLTIQLVGAILGIVIARYVIPWLKSRVDDKKMAEAEKWADRVVRWAQDWLQASPGEERRNNVLSVLQTINEDKRLGLTEEQIDILVRSAYTVMMEEMAKSYGTEAE